MGEWGCGGFVPVVGRRSFLVAVFVSVSVLAVSFAGSALLVHLACLW